jgi:uncharacterized protein (DUF1330 family)
MAAYLVATFDVNDQEAYEDYRPIVVPLLEKHGAEILATDYDGDVLEGEERGAFIIMRFESEESILNFYNDPDYQPSRALRLRTISNGTVAIVKEGYTPPPTDNS